MAVEETLEIATAASTVGSAPVPPVFAVTVTFDVDVSVTAPVAMIAEAPLS